MYTLIYDADIFVDIKQMCVLTVYKSFNVFNLNVALVEMLQLRNLILMKKPG